MQICCHMTPHNRPTLGLAEQEAASRVLASGWIAQGAEVDAFEHELCEFFGIPNGHAVVVSSGSAALYLALRALDGRDKEIGLPVYSCAALRNAVGLVGGRGVYLDCAEGTPNVDTNAVAETSLDILIAPSIFGIPVAIPQIRSYKVIEDLAQSLGAKVGEDRIGLRGDVGICSFYATKMITSGGQGGAVISHSKDLIEAIRDYRKFDCRDDAKLRFNFQMTDMQAAIGRVQLKRLPAFIEQREKCFALYRAAGLDLLDSRCPEMKPVRYRAIVRCSDQVRVINALASAGMKAIIPVEAHELLDTPDCYPVAHALTHTTISLPIYPGLTDEDIHRIAQITKEET